MECVHSLSFLHWLPLRCMLVLPFRCLCFRTSLSSSRLSVCRRVGNGLESSSSWILSSSATNPSTAFSYRKFTLPFSNSHVVLWQYPRFIFILFSQFINIHFYIFEHVKYLFFIVLLSLEFSCATFPIYCICNFPSRPFICSRSLLFLQCGSYIYGMSHTGWAPWVWGRHALILVLNYFVHCHRGPRPLCRQAVWICTH